MHKNQTIKTFACLAAYLFILSSINAQTTLYSEGFSGQNGKGAIGGAGGITIDTSGVSWSVDTSQVNFQDVNDYIQVVTERIEFRDTEGLAKWSSPAIDISNYDSLTLSIDLLEVGTMEGSDSIKVYYKIDNGSEVEVKFIDDDYSSYTLTDTALAGTGSELYIIVYALNGADSEKHRIDNVVVKGKSTTVIDGISMSALGTAVKLTFDASVVGANNGQFNGSGISSSPNNGQLNSSGISIDGFSDGDVSFDSTNTTGDYSRGTSSGGVSTGGLYAFEVSSGDFALGHQSTAGDFTPGNFDFRLKNNTGSTATKLTVNYDVYEYNDQGIATVCNLYTSTNDTTYTIVSGTSITSVEAASGGPTWVKSNVSKTITGLTWANGEYFYVRFNFDDASGSGSRDEIALDNISFIAKDNSTPSALPGSLSGTYANLNIDAETGEISASGNLIVTNNLNLTNGFLNLNSNTLELGTSTSDVSITGGSSSSFIYGGTIKSFVNNATNTYNFPIGSSTSEYSNVSIDFTSSTLAAGSYLEVSVDANKHPNFSGFVSSYIDRNWTIEATGITSPNYTVELNYVNDDVVGTEADILPVKYSGGSWTSPFDIGNNNVDTVGRGSIDVAQNKMTWSGVTSFSLYGGAGNGTPLPVVLGDFSGEHIAKNKVKLTWTTEAEINCDYFILEKLNGDNRYTSIAQLSGAGTTNEKTNYDYIDLQANTGDNFYRLTQVDFNGELEVFPVLKVSASQELEATASIAIEVNRANQTIRLNGASIDTRSIKILNTQGQEVGLEIIAHNEKECILKPAISERGVFLLLLEEADGNAQNLKFVW